MENKTQEQLDKAILKRWNKMKGASSFRYKVDELMAATLRLEQQRASEYLRKTCWSEKDIELFLKWGN